MAGPDFAALLKTYRERRGLAQRALARAAQINPAIISRMESGDRGPSGPPQVLAIARALGLAAEEADALLASAGFWPQVYLALGPGDPTLRAAARVLASPDLGDEHKERFRRLVALLAEEWLAGAEGAAEVRP